MSPFSWRRIAVTSRAAEKPFTTAPTSHRQHPTSERLYSSQSGRHRTSTQRQQSSLNGSPLAPGLAILLSLCLDASQGQLASDRRRIPTVAVSGVAWHQRRALNQRPRHLLFASRRLPHFPRHFDLLRNPFRSAGVEGPRLQELTGSRASSKGQKCLGRATYLLIQSQNHTPRALHSTPSLAKGRVMTRKSAE